MVADVAGVKTVQKLEGAVIERQPQDAHVVGVHHAMAKAYGLPLGQQVGGALGDGGQQGQVARRARVGFQAMGVKVGDHKVGQLAQLLGLPAFAEVLEMPEADKAGRHAGDHGGRFGLLAPNCGVRAGHAQRAGGGDAQAVHGFAAQKFADRAAQHRAPVPSAGKRRGPRALELNFLARQFP